MRLIRGISNLLARSGANALPDVDVQKLSSGSVVTVGAFDGVHKGHQSVLQHLRNLAAEHGMPSVVMTLEPLPREFFAPLSAPPRLMSFREKFEEISSLGIDYLCLVKFNESVRNTEAESFAHDVFVRHLRCKHLVIGDDFRIGRDGGGDFELLKKLGERYGYDVTSTDTLSIDAERVSSTRIRELLLSGDIAAAEILLGRPYRITGRVLYGQQLGRTLDAPTANIQLRRLKAAMQGVYAVTASVIDETSVDGSVITEWPAVANIGTRPTVNESIEAVLEVHLIDFSGDLYGKRMSIRFCHKIRDEQKFESVEKLKEQIHRDIDTAKSYFKNA